MEVLITSSDFVNNVTITTDIGICGDDLQELKRRNMRVGLPLLRDDFVCSFLTDFPKALQRDNVVYGYGTSAALFADKLDLARYICMLIVDSLIDKLSNIYGEMVYCSVGLIEFAPRLANRSVNSHVN